MSLNLDQQIETVEINIETAKSGIALAEALDRLYSNKDFQQVILEGFFKEEASRAVMLRASAEMAGKEQQKQVNDIITSIGGLYQYFSKIFGLADMFKRSLEADQETHEELLREQANEGALQ